MEPVDPQPLNQSVTVFKQIEEIRKKYPKLLYHLIPPLPLAELAYVYTMGAAKHSPNGWIEKPMPFDELFGRIFRHTEKIRQGEMFCLEDGQMHASSVAWSAFALSQYQMMNIGEDNRRIYLPQHMEIIKP